VDEERELWLRERIQQGSIVNQVLVLIGLGLACILVPSLIHIENVVGHVIRDLGIAILTAGVLGVAYEYKLRNDFVKTTTERLGHVLREHDRTLVASLEKFHKSGLERIHDSLPIELLEENFRKPSPRIRVLQTWTGFRDQGLMGLLFTAAQTKGRTVQVLLLDPNSEQVRYRANAMDTVDEEGARTDIVGDLNELCRLRNKLPEECGIEVRVYDAHPAIHIYDFYDTKILGIHWRQIRSIKGPQLEIVGATSDLALRLDSHFDSLWTDQRTRDVQEALNEYQQKYVRQGNDRGRAQPANTDLHNGI
jgi:hypothetical protein